MLLWWLHFYTITRLEFLAMTNLAQRFCSCESHYSSSTPTLQHAWALLHIWHTLIKWRHSGEWDGKMGISEISETERMDWILDSWRPKGKVGAFYSHCFCVLFFFSLSSEGTIVSFADCVPTKADLKLHVAKSENIEAWLEVFMWCCWRVLISGF